MAIPFGQFSFVCGEISPGLFGHVDFQKWHLAASTMRNMFVSYRTGAYSRAGTSFVGFSKQTGRTVAPRLITFQFDINQGLALEFGNFYMRVVANGGFVTENAKTITGITQATPAVITSAAHGYSDGDWVSLSGIVGMTQLNGQTVVVQGAGANTYQIYDVYGNPVNTTAFPAYTSGGSSARIFTLTTPYAEADLQYLKFTQSADVMSLTCWNQVTLAEYPPYDLSRISDSNWTLVSPTFGSTIAAPAAATGSASSAGTTDYNYVVTAVSNKDGSESVASPIADVPNAVDIANTLGTITITWSTVLNRSVYNIYKASPNPEGSVPTGALFGFCGQSFGNQFTDSNIVPDFTQVPPLHENPFARGTITDAVVTATGSATGYTINTATGLGAVLELIVVGSNLVDITVINPGQGYLPTDTVTITGTATAKLVVGPQSGTYPGVVNYYQERRVYASTQNNPDTYFFSKPGAFTNFDSRIPSVADDAITGTPWSVEVNGIQFLVSMPGGLVVLTGLSAWQLTGVGGSSLNPQPITPANQQAQPQAYNGCSATVPPVKIDYDILYVQAKGSIYRDLSYNFFVNIYTGADLTQLSSQLFTGFTIIGHAWCEEPYKILWVVRDDGILLSLTYLKPQEVDGWARHDTHGRFQSVCAVTEPPVDALYLAVERFPGGNTAYMIERMDNRIWNGIEDCWCVDAGLSLPQPTPNATLSASSATGLGSITGVTNLVGGQNYSAATTATVVDANGQGPGNGAVPILTIVGGAITNIVFPPGSQGQSYVYPALQFNDPTGQGSGASASPTLNNSATFTASSPIFSATSVGSVIRMGGGIATITGYTDPQHVTANITSPIVSAICPNSGGFIQPQLPGSWTLTIPTQTISGLIHLAGATVTGLYDGNVIPPTIVSAQGTIMLPAPATAVTVGLGFQAQLQSVYLDVGQPTIQGQRKKIAGVVVRTEASRGLKVGVNQPDGSTLSPIQVAPAWSNLDPVPDEGTPPYGSTVIPLYTGDSKMVPVTGGYARPGQVAVQQDNPLPMNVLAFVPLIEGGDLPQPPGPPRQQQKAA